MRFFLVFLIALFVFPFSQAIAQTTKSKSATQPEKSKSAAQPEKSKSASSTDQSKTSSQSTNLKNLDQSNKIYLRNSDFEYIDDKTFAYYFSASLSTESEKSALEGQFSDLVVTTEDGDITFEETFNWENDLTIVTKFTTNKFISKFVITKVTAKHNNIDIDLTENMRLSFYKPIPIEIKSKIYNNCPSKTLNFTVKNGVYKGLQSGEIVRAVIDFGKDNVIGLLYNEEVADFVENEDNFEKKVKFIIKEEQSFELDASLEESKEACKKEPYITNIMLAE
ncbi:MAG: hypothetical protein LBV23_08570 [Deltaproteobacteria bacterium]|jgi:hypothetical protein|nr:hypothetical protein [Deltaproteobacteria bacterium]